MEPTDDDFEDLIASFPLKDREYVRRIFGDYREPDEMPSKE